MDETKKLPERMNRTLNGPQRPSMPQASPFLVEDAEAEIRRSVQRHYEMQATIETLKTDLAGWRQRAELAEAELERMKDKLDEREHRIDELKNGVATLRAQFETGAQIWLNGYRQLQDLGHVKLVTPPALLEALEHKEAESDR